MPESISPVPPADAGARVAMRPAPLLRWSILALAASMAVGLAGCNRKSETAAGPTQAAARINGDEITVHQVNAVLQGRGVPPEQVKAAGNQVLDQLINQQVAIQAAVEQKLDRDPQVIQAIEAARRDVLARTYLERATRDMPAPTDTEIRTYYDAHPELFAHRRVYLFQETQIEGTAEQIEKVRTELSAAKSPADFNAWLKGSGLRFSNNQAMRPAEQVPLPMLGAVAKLKDGEALFNPVANGVRILFVIQSAEQPATFDQAKPMIKQFLTTEARRQRADADVKALRAKAKIEYLGGFAAPVAASAASAAAALPDMVASGPGEVGGKPAEPSLPPPAPASAGASSALSSQQISKGLGLK